MRFNKTIRSMGSPKGLFQSKLIKRFLVLVQTGFQEKCAVFLVFFFLFFICDRSFCCSCSSRGVVPVQARLTDAFLFLNDQ